jgi:hypothetical protein
MLILNQSGSGGPGPASVERDESADTLKDSKR